MSISESKKNKVKRKIKNNLIILLVLVLILVLRFGSGYIITRWAASTVSNSSHSFTGSINVAKDGAISSNLSAEELWNEMIRQGYPVDQYLSNPQELDKLLKAELVTRIPDTREDVSQPRDWDKIFSTKLPYENISVLFIGNSKTFYNELPTRVKDLSKSLGKNLTVASCTQGGRTLIETYESEDFRKKVKSRKWDYVVLQEQTDNSLSSSLLKKGASQLVDYIRKNSNSNVKIIYDAWGIYNDFNEKQFDQAINSNEAARDETGGKIAYIAKALLKCHSEKPEVSLFCDEIHPTHEATYLAACCTYIAMFNESPCSLEYVYDLDQNLAYDLQTIAEEVQEEYCTDQFFAEDLQGVIKFVRHNEDGNQSYMTYATPEEFNGWLQEYNNSGSEDAKNNALSHFTLTQKATTKSSSSKGKISAGEGVMTDISQRILDAAAITPWQDAGWCAAWVFLIYDNMGIAPDRKDCAREAAYAHMVSDDINNIPIGASVYSEGSGYYGHIGIYLGSGQVMDNWCDGVRTWDIHDWLEANGGDPDGWIGWGWEDGNKVRGTVDDPNIVQNKQNNQKDKKSEKNKDEKNKKEAAKNSLDAVIEAAKSQLGQPYNYEASAADPGGAGFNCSGLVWWSYEQAGYTVDHAQCAYGCSAPDRGMIDTVYKNCGKLLTNESELCVGDVLFYNTGDGRESGHVALYMGNGQRIHANGSEVAIDSNAFNSSFIGGGPLITDAERKSSMSSNDDTSNHLGYQAIIATWTEIQKSTSIDNGSPHIDSAANYMRVSIEDSITYKMNTTTVDYESLVDQYTLDFDMLWSFLVIGQSKNFVMEWADMAYNSDIEIGVYDNLRVTTDIDSWSYSEVTDVKVSGDIFYNDSTNGVHAGPRSVEHEHIYSKGARSSPKEDGVITKTVITKTNTATTALTKAHTWIADYDVSYTYNNDGESITNSEKTLDNHPITEWYEGSESDDQCIKIEAGKDIVYQQAEEQYAEINAQRRQEAESTKARGEELSEDPYINSVGASRSYLDTSRIKVELQKVLVDIVDHMTDKVSNKKYTAGTPTLVIKEEKNDDNIKKKGSNKKETEARSNGSGQFTSKKGDGYFDTYITGTGHEYKHFVQNEGGYANLEYINSKMSKIGSGVTSVAIAASGLRPDLNITPYNTREYFITEGGTDGDPSPIIKYFKESIGVNSVKDNDLTPSHLKDLLNKGKVIILHSKAPHYYVVVDVDEKGNFVVLDPVDKDSQTEYKGSNVFSYNEKKCDYMIVADAGGTKIASLDNFLFIGDSRYAEGGLTHNAIKEAGKNITICGVGSSRVKEWLDVARNNGKGKVQDTQVDITGKYSGISIQLGANSPGQIDEMKDLIKQLKSLHPNIPILVNSCLGVSSNYSTEWASAAQLQENINIFNRAIEQFCDNENNVYYIDISNGLVGSDGYVKKEYMDSEGLHIATEEAAKIFVNNLKGATLSNTRETTAVVSTSAGGFVELFNKPKYKRNRDNILVGAKWLFSIMEENEKLIEKIDLIKYLLYKATDTNFGVTEFDYSFLDPNSSGFSSVSNGGDASSDLLAFLETVEGAGEKDGEDYIVFYTSVDGCLNVGSGVVVKDGNGSIYHPEILPNPYDGQRVSKETYKQLKEKVMKIFTDAVDEALASQGVTVKSYQRDAMVSFCYNCGSGYASELVTAYKNGGNEGFKNYILQFTHSGSEYLLGLDRRRHEEYEMFESGDYVYDPDF